ncbi:MAG: ArdC family protein [Caulobacterales bacterium]
MQSSVLSEKRFDVHRAITDKIIAAMEGGAGDFVMPWHRQGPGAGRPTNALTLSTYRGVNVVALWAEALTRGYGSGWWATFNQWKELGARVLKGEHGAMIVFYKSLAGPADESLEDDERPLLMARAYRVFNKDQVDGWRPPQAPTANPVVILAEVEAFVTSTAADVRHGGDTACYRANLDVIDMPPQVAFQDTGTSSATEAYYATLLHELTHWSGAKHRLDREFGGRFGADGYAMEELVAELGAAFLCADLRITNEPRPDHAAYLSSWLSVLRADRRAIFTAAQKANEATAFLAALSAGTPPF